MGTFVERTQQLGQRQVAELMKAGAGSVSYDGIVTEMSDHIKGAVGLNRL